MGTSLTPNPLAYVHPDALSWRNVRYGPHTDHRLNIYRNSTRVSGGNPLFIIVHGGSWEANDKTDFVEGPGSSAALGLFWLAYLLDSASYGTTEYFDVVSVEYSCHSHDRLNTSGSSKSVTYEDATTYVSGASGSKRVMVKSYPTYNGQSVDDLQRAYQWLRDNAHFWGWDTSRFVAFGHSVGGNTTINAVYSPSRAWNPRATGVFDAKSEVRIAACLQWEAEVDLDPWFMFNQHAKNLTGFVETDVTITGVRGDLERKYLIPDSTTGLYPQGSLKTEACKAMSPVDVIARYGPGKTHIPMRSYYFKNFGSVPSPPPPYGTYAETDANQGDYTTIPPYNASGHDWRQQAFLAAACASAGVSHTGTVIDGATDVPLVGPTGSPPTWAPDLQIAFEITLAPSYAWMVDAIS